MRVSVFCIVLCLTVASSFSSFSQTKFDCLSDTVYNFEHDSSRLFVHADMHQFLKNNEYFNPIVEGYTLLGTSLKTGIYFTPSSKSKIYTGLSALWYNGDKSFEYFVPDFSIQYNFHKDFAMIIGSLPSVVHHTLSPMLLNYERFLSKPSEKGLEFLLSKKHVDWNCWLSWEQFLHPYEHSQEHIFLGNSFEYRPIIFDHFSLGFPVQFTVYHEGGQINDVWMPLQMMFNNAVGVRPKYTINEKTVELSYSYLGYKDGATHSVMPYQNGDGHYVRSSFMSKHCKVLASYWQGFQFYAPRGEQIYSSVSQTIPLAIPSTDQKERKVLIYEFYYTNELAKNLHILCGAELFQDIKNNIIDYNYSLSVRYSGDFFLKKL